MMCFLNLSTVINHRVPGRGEILPQEFDIPTQIVKKQKFFLVGGISPHVRCASKVEGLI